MQDRNGREIVSPVDRLVAEMKDSKRVLGYDAEQLKGVTFYVSIDGVGWHVLNMLYRAGFNAKPVWSDLEDSMCRYYNEMSEGERRSRETLAIISERPVLN